MMRLWKNVTDIFEKPLCSLYVLSHTSYHTPLGLENIDPEIHPSQFATLGCYTVPCPVSIAVFTRWSGHPFPVHPNSQASSHGKRALEYSRPPLY